MISLRHLTDVRVSNVDKKSKDDEVPVRLVNYMDVYYGDRIVPEMRLMAATASRNQIKIFALNPGDVVITKDSESADDIGVPAFVERTASDIVCGYHLAILRPRPKTIDGRFLYWTMNSQDIRGQMESTATGITRFGLRIDAINQIKIRVPSHSMQRAIVSHLDRETARIDTLISKKRQLILLLEECRTLLAEDSLARLRRNEPLVPLKYLVHECDLRYGAGPEPTMLSVSIHQGVAPRSAISDKQPRADDLSKYKNCNPGDIVINRMRAFQGGVGVVGQAGVVSPDYTVLQVGSRVSPNYLHYVMRSSWFISEMTRRLRGIGSTDQGRVRTPRINFADLGLIEVPVPPKEAQDRLSSKLASQHSRLTQAIDLQSRQLNLLAERRQTLITAIVTGEISASVEV